MTFNRDCGRSGVFALPALALTALTCVAHAGSQGSDTLIGLVMKDRYGASYVRAHGCWLYIEKHGRYCVKPLKSEWVGAGEMRRLYLLTSGVPVNPDESINKLPAHVLPGLVGAFTLVASPDGKPKYLAATDALMFGSFGDSGAAVAQLTRIGAADYYAWVFSSGGTWQGISVGDYHILAPHEGTFLDLSTIPAMREADQDHRYAIEFDASNSNQRVFPLIVEKRPAADGANGLVLNRFVVPFNPKTWRYEMPPDR